MFWIFNELLYRPLFNATVLLYNLIPGQDFGLAIISLTIIIRIILFPLSVKALKSQKAIAKINPKTKELKEKHKNDQVAYNKAVMDLYKEHGVNPMAGCLPLLIQLPVIIALYQAFVAGFNPENLKALLYTFIQNPEAINKTSLGFIDVTAKNHPMAILTGIVQFFQSKMAVSQMPSAGDGIGKELSSLNGQMLYFFPVMIIIIGWNLSAGIVLYFLTTTLFSIVEQMYIKKFKQ